MISTYISVTSNNVLTTELLRRRKSRFNLNPDPWAIKQKTLQMTKKIVYNFNFVQIVNNFFWSFKVVSRNSQIQMTVNYLDL